MAGVIAGLFAIEHNRLPALEQEYELAKEHQREVLKCRVPLNPEHQRRFADACDRLDSARERYIAALDEQG
ncbi:hypothetical protein P12x_005280 [Tundrisphaera lichenicola]|uniref:hypothetical protein n=1 Tax=Tundrisphaera lichenicola TaxID=2029860 RepID=UPI003EBBEE0E